MHWDYDIILAFVMYFVFTAKTVCRENGKIMTDFRQRLANEVTEQNWSHVMRRNFLCTSN